MHNQDELDVIQQQTGMDRAQAHYHARGREILRLRLGSTNRAARPQHDTSDCPLFVAANEPRFL